MKKVFSFVFLLALFPVYANLFTLGSKQNPAFVRVEKKGDSLQISCRFKAQTKFSADVNAKFNDRKADNLCKQALMLYFHVPQGSTISLAGIVSDQPHKIYGKEVEYFFFDANAGTVAEKIRRKSPRSYCTKSGFLKGHSAIS